MPRPAAAIASGDAIIAVAALHLGETYVFGARAPMSNASWKGPWDCAEFASWSVHQSTGILFGTVPSDDPVRADAFTGFWADQALGAGADIRIDDAVRVPGAALLRVPRTSQIGHIALSDGIGGTIEAHSAAVGVARLSVSGRRWDFGVLVPGVRYLMGEQPVPFEAPRLVLRVTQPLLRGPLIQKIQRRLQRLGHPVGAIDGIYGPQTAHAVQQFQMDHGLAPDGEVGPATAELLEVELA